MKEIPREKMTLRQLQDSQQAHQAAIALEAEVRKLAREHGLDTAEVTQLARASWGAFRIVNGEALPVAGDRQTVLLAADGVSVLSVREWERGTIGCASPHQSDSPQNPLTRPAATLSRSRERGLGR